MISESGNKKYPQNKTTLGKGQKKKASSPDCIGNFEGFLVLKYNVSEFRVALLDSEPSIQEKDNLLGTYEIYSMKKYLTVLVWETAVTSDPIHQNIIIISVYYKIF